MNLLKNIGRVILAYTPAILHCSPKTKANKFSTLKNNTIKVGKAIKISFLTLVYHRILFLKNLGK